VTPRSLVLAAAVAALAAACGTGPEAASPVTTAPATASTVPSTTTTTTMPTTTTTVDPGALPQTRDRPAAAGPQWDAGVAALWRAVVADDPAAARPFFFPLTAYRQVKAIRDPDGDYRDRLLRAYDDDIHALHGRLGPDSQLVGIQVGSPAWIDPGVEYNKGAYWRVLGNTLTWTSRGQRRTAPVASLISWRGEWYVVHLSSIR
jgi:hypothetical protein